MTNTVILPRILRLHDAPAYVGMDRQLFEELVRPRIEEIPIGKRGIGFDRLDLDAWVEDHKSSNGRPGKGVVIWDAKDRRGSSSVVKPGLSKSQSTVEELEKVVGLVTSRKRKTT